MISKSIISAYKYASMIHALHNRHYIQNVLNNKHTMMFVLSSLSRPSNTHSSSITNKIAQTKKIPKYESTLKKNVKIKNKYIQYILFRLTCKKNNINVSNMYISDERWYITEMYYHHMKKKTKFW